MKKKQKDQSVRKQIMSVFLVSGAKAFDASDLRKLSASLPSCLSGPAAAFVVNLDASVSVICMPVSLAMASAHQWRFRQLHIAERIRAGSNPNANPDSPEEKEAREKAHKRFSKEVVSKDGINHLADDACTFLLSQHSQPQIADAARVLLLQAAVLLWSAFEVLARDVFEAVVNTRPELGRALLESVDGKRLFQVKAIDVDTLARYSFDLSKRMGSVLSEYRDMSDLAAIRGVLGALFPTADRLRSLLGSKDLWTLSQRRHLIVHNRGIVDRKYLQQTGTSDEEGKCLVLSPSDIERYAGLVRDAGHALLQEAQKTLAGI